MHFHVCCFPFRLSLFERKTKKPKNIKKKKTPQKKIHFYVCCFDVLCFFFACGCVLGKSKKAKKNIKKKVIKNTLFSCYDCGFMKEKRKKKKMFRPKGPGYVKAFFTDGHPWRKGGGLIPWDQIWTHLKFAARPTERALSRPVIISPTSHGRNWC